MAVGEHNKRLVREASGVFDSKRALVDGAFGPLEARLTDPLVTRFVELAAYLDTDLLARALA